MSTVRKSLAWSFAERYFSQMIALISSMILARLLTPEQIGIFSLCAALTMIATIFRDFGVSEYLIQEKQLTKDKLQGAYALTLITAWLMAAILYLIKDSIAAFYNEQGVAEIISVLCLNFIILPFASPAFALMNRDMAFNRIFVVQASSAIVHAITAVSLAYLGFAYMSLAWASLANIISQTVLITLLRPKETFLLPSLKQVRHVWRFGLAFSLSRMIEVLMNNAHELIIGRQYGFTQLGLFSRAYGFINLFWVNVTSAITRVAAPSFSKSYRQSDKLLFADYNNALSLFTVIAWPFFCFIALESYNLIYLLFGEQWLKAAPIASILAVASLVSSVIALAPNALIAMGMVKRRLWISIIIAPVHIIGILLASMFDILYVATIWAVTWLLALILYNHHLTKTLGFTYQHLLSSVKKSALVTLFSFIPVTGSYYLFDVSGISGYLSLPVNCLIMLMSWLFATYVTKHPIFSEIRNSLISIIKSRNNLQS